MCRCFWTGVPAGLQSRDSIPSSPNTPTARAQLGLRPITGVTESEPSHNNRRRDSSAPEFQTSSSQLSRSLTFLALGSLSHVIPCSVPPLHLSSSLHTSLAPPVPGELCLPPLSPAPPLTAAGDPGTPIVLSLRKVLRLAKTTPNKRPGNHQHKQPEWADIIYMKEGECNTLKCKYFLQR